MKCRYLFAFLLPGVAFVAGCNLAPTYERPPAPMPSTWPTLPNAAAAIDTAGPLVGWETFYRDPSLRRLIRLGLENNRDLRQVALNAEAFRALYRIQHAALLPEVAGDAGESRKRVPSTVSGTEHGLVQGQFQVQASASYELDFFGKVKNLDEAALQTYLATEEAHQSAQLALVGSIADAYLAWRTDQALQALVISTLTSYEHSLRLVQSSHEAGLASALAVRQAQGLVLQARTQQTIYQRRVAEDSNALQRLLGAPVPGDLDARVAPADAVAFDVPVGLPSDLLLRRPDIRAAEHSLRAANANIGAARAAFFPSIRLSAGLGTASSSLDDLFGAGSGTWSFAPSVSVPIFSAGRLAASRDYAVISKDADVAHYEAVIQQAFREVSDGLAGRQTYTTQLDNQQAEVRNAQEALTLAKDRFSQGLDGYLVVLDSQRTLFATQQALQTNQLGRLSAEVALFRALGGGWDAPPASVGTSERTVPQDRNGKLAVSSPR